MTSPKDGFLRSFIVQYGVQILGLAMAVGAFASMTQNRTEQLSRDIDVAKAVARADLDSAVKVRTVQMESMEHRVAILEQIARDTSEALKSLEKGQAVLVTNVSHQSAIVARIETKLDERSRP